MSRENGDEIMARLEMIKANMDAGGMMVKTQTIEVEFFKTKCHKTYCGRTFYEFESQALEYCPHCAAKVDPYNLGESIKAIYEIDTLTGSITMKGYER